MERDIRDGSSCCASAETGPTIIREDVGSIPALLGGLRIWSCGVGYRRRLDLVLLWLCCRLAAAAPIGPLTWELPYVAGAALKKKKKKKKKKRERETKKEKGWSRELVFPACTFLDSLDFYIILTSSISKKITQVQRDEPENKYK